MAEVLIKKEYAVLIYHLSPLRTFKLNGKCAKYKAFTI